MSGELQSVWMGGRSERYVRRAWETNPGLMLRLAGDVYGAATRLRHLLYRHGVLRGRDVPVPVISVGGLTVGGSGKTPVSAAIAAWLAADGMRVGIATHGFEDELHVHARLNPTVIVRGGRARGDAVRQLAVAKADVVVIDDGFQHRRLARDLEVVTVDAETARSNRPRFLPAGPYREAPAELGRAQVIVVTRRRNASDDVVELTDRLRRRFTAALVARCHMRPGPLVAANRAARLAPAPEPEIVVASIMKSDLFVSQVAERYPTVRIAYTFPDHAAFARRDVERIIQQGAPGGMVGTLKDIVKLEDAVGDSVPLWYQPDEIVWERGEMELRRAVRQVVPERRRSVSALEARTPACG